MVVNMNYILKCKTVDTSSHNSFYGTECFVHHEKKNVIAVFNIIFCVGRESALSVLMRIVLKK